MTAATSQLSVAFAALSSNGGSAITNYQYSTDGGTTWSTPSPATTASPPVITVLVDGTTYQVALRAVNAVGAGAASAPATGTSMGTPTAPIGLAATAGNASAALSWTAPANTGGSAITDYTVRYSGNGGASWTMYAHAPSSASLGEWTVSSGIWKNTTAGSNDNNAIAVLTSDVDKSAPGTTAAQTGGMTASTSWTAAVLVLRPTP